MAELERCLDDRPTLWDKQLHAVAYGSDTETEEQDLEKVGKVNGVISALVSLKDNQFIRFIKLNMVVMFDVSKLLTKFLEGIWKILEKLQQELCNGVPVQQITGMKTQLSKLFKLRNIHEMSSVEFFFYRNTTISGSLQNSCSKCCNSSIC